MTGKRFTIKHYESQDWAYDNNKLIHTKKMVDLLNELHEENKELKKENAQFDILIKNNQLAYIDLEKENEQLKHELLCKQLDKAPTEPINCRCQVEDLEKRSCSFCKHCQIDGMFGMWCDKGRNWKNTDATYCSDYER